MFKKFLSGIMAVAVCVVGLSGCGESPSEETTSETTTEVTTAKYSEEELEQMAQNMPEIVFVHSYRMYDTNIYGYFITNTGEMKMFDFRQIAPDEYYEIPDVLDKLDEAVCEKIDILYEGIYWGDTIYDYQLKDVPKEELTELYKKMLLIDKNNMDIFKHHMENYDFINTYGIRKNDELILLHGNDSIYRYNSLDTNCCDIVYALTSNYFPV